MSEKSSFSIALCTYNGEHYLSGQLDSFIAQTRKPDELVICDDGSTDNTPDIIEAFCKTAPFPVQVHTNTSSLGPTGNFSRAIALCTGDLIALSDQDDVWHPEKIEHLDKVFSERPEVGGLFSDAEIVGPGLEPLGYSIWQRVGFDAREQELVVGRKAFPVLLKHSCVTGCTLAFRSALRTELLPIPEQWQHDAWLALVLAAGSFPLDLLPERLVKYRQHASNVTGGRKKNLSERIRCAIEVGRVGYLHTELERWEELRKHLYNLADADSLNRLDEKLAHLQYRLSMPRPRLLRLPFVLREWVSGRYHRYNKDWTSIAADLFMP